MGRHIIVYTTDKRQEKLVTLLKKEVINDFGDVEKVEDKISESIYVLPIPVTKLDGNQKEKNKLKQELIKAVSLEEMNLKVFGGVLTPEWIAFLEKYKIPYWDFMKLLEVVEGNAWITAEATLAEVLLQSEVSLCGQTVLVTGYGCCGEKIAKLFGKLGADVIVAARRPQVREQIQKDGFSAVAFDEMKKGLAKALTVINTVPSMVLTEEVIRQMKKDALIIDIASKPGGTDFEAAKRYGIKAKLALGLPGIYTTSSSAQLLKNAIYQYAPLKENKKGDKLWISQVII